MKEQSDTPRTDAAEQFVSYFGWQVHADFARDLERELATATRERDEARADLDRFRHTAKRYRYIASWFSVMSADIDGNHFWVSRISSSRLRGPSFDDAVDRAMKRDHWEHSALAATEAP